MGEEIITVVKPIKPEEISATGYIDYLSEKIEHRKENEGDIFYNDGKRFASLLMATLLQNTHESLKMYCTGLRPGILCGKKEGDGRGYEGAYWDAFKNFFSDKNEIFKKNGTNKIQILIQTKKWLHYMPFKKVAKCMENHPGYIQVRHIRKNGIAHLFDYLNIDKGGKNNFAIFDDKAYRIEYNPDRFFAEGSFYDPKMCKYLGGIFDYEFENADIVSKAEILN